MSEQVLTDCMKIVNDLYAKGIVLNGHGIFDKRAIAEWLRTHTDGRIPTPYTRETLGNIEPIMKAIRIIPFLVKTTTRKGLIGSYGLKHVLEKTFFVENRGSYMSNGEAILAMLFLKYKVHLSEQGSWNCTFNCMYAKNDFNDIAMNPNPQDRETYLKF
jgi:hypothetical protein